MSINRQLEVTCDRCGEPVPDTIITLGGTGNYYSVTSQSYWSKFARPGEREVCDACMWADPLYQAEYGETSA